MSLVDGEAIGSSGFSMGGVIGASISSLSHQLTINWCKLPSHKKFLFSYFNELSHNYWDEII